MVGPFAYRITLIVELIVALFPVNLLKVAALLQCALVMMDGSMSDEGVRGGEHKTATCPLPLQ